MGVFLHHLFRALSGYVQKWTKQNIPSECPVLHDFGDGEGAVPAVPVDNCGVRNDIATIFTIPINTDMCGVRSDISGITTYPVNNDVCGVRNDIISIEPV